MRIVLQRVSSASVTIAGEVVGRIDSGLMLLIGIEAADTAEDGAWLAEKITKLRIFEDSAGKMNLSLLDLADAKPCPPSSAPCPLILAVSQFTLHANTAKGTRPSFNAAARPEHAKPFYELFIKQLEQASGRPVAKGRFGATMQVSIVNEGPVTLILDSKSRV